MGLSVVRGPGEVTRIACRANGLWGWGESGATSQLAVCWKLEPSDKSKKGSTQMGVPLTPTFYFENLKTYRKVEGREL